MTEAIRTVTVTRDFPYPPDKLWRALTQPELIEDWIAMKSDFKPEVGHSFKFSADWGAVDCEVVEIEPHKVLAYKWEAFGLESVVTWTLTPTTTGTTLRMDQVGFRPDQEYAYQGAQQAWPNYFDAMDKVLAAL